MYDLAVAAARRLNDRLRQLSQIEIDDSEYTEYNIEPVPTIPTGHGLIKKEEVK